MHEHDGTGGFRRMQVQKSAKAPVVHEHILAFSAEEQRSKAAIAHGLPH